MLIENPTRLDELCRQLEAAGEFALDTEFVQERSYFPKLGIIQVATDDLGAIIDPIPIGDLSPFLELITAPGVRKVVHSGTADFSIFYSRTGRAPVNVFDTQPAAALVGHGASIGLGKLVEALMGKKLPKSATRSDWTRRPLSREQIEYALDDVRYLLPMTRKLESEIDARGRRAWLVEQLAPLEDPATYQRPDGDELWRRVRGSQGLDGRTLAVLQKLAAWREEAAMDEDVPRQRIARDDVLVDLARRRPTRGSDLRGMRFLHHRVAQQWGRTIIDAVRAGLEAPEVERPVRPRERPDDGSLVSLLDAWLQQRAVDEAVAARVLATQDDLKDFVRADPEERESLPLLSTWRSEVVGKELLELLSGSASIGVEPGSSRLRLQR